MDTRQAIQEADRYAREKGYGCLFPKCTKPAVRCHSVQRATCVDALAADGKVYTVHQSYSQFIENRTGAGPMRIVKEGLSRASTFNGFCGEHDALLFSRAEGKDRNLKVNGMLVAFHLRAVALEYCRWRRTADFLKKKGELTDDKMEKAVSNDLGAAIDAKNEIFKELYMESVFAMFFGSKADAIMGLRGPRIISA